MNYTTHILGTLLLVPISSALSSTALASPCAKAQVMSGTNCDNLIIKFFLAGCGDAGGKATLECTKGGKNTATFKSKKATYSVNFSERDSWGAKSWDIDGEIQATPLPPPKKREIAVTSESSTENSTYNASASSSNHSDLTFSGIFDGYFSANLNNLAAYSPSTTAAGGNANGYLTPPQNKFRANDLYSNSFAVNFIELSVQKKTKEVLYKMDLDFGMLADWLAGPSISTTTPLSATETIFNHIGQAIVSWTPSDAPNMTLNIGKLATYIGLEGPKTKDNWNYSRSFLFQLGVPFYHTGANIQYAAIPGKMSLGLHVYNPIWNTILPKNAGKTFGAQLTLTPDDSLAINVNVMVSPLNPGDAASKTILFNQNTVWTTSSSFSLAYDFVTASQANSAWLGGINGSWTAFEILSKINFTSKFYLSPRFEIFSDPQGLQTMQYYDGMPATPQTLSGVTLTAGILLADGLETRFETRFDNSTTSAFKGSSGTSNTQTTALVSVLYTF